MKRARSSFSGASSPFTAFSNSRALDRRAFDNAAAATSYSRRATRDASPNATSLAWPHRARRDRRRIFRPKPPIRIRGGIFSRHAAQRKKPLLGALKVMGIEIGRP